MRLDVPTSLGRCLVLLRYTISHTMGTGWAIAQADALTLCVEQPRGMPGYVKGAWLAQHWHRQVLGAGVWLFEKNVPILDIRCYGEPVSHTIDSNCAMVPADALTSLRTCLALLQAVVSHTIGTCLDHGASRSLD